MLKMNLDNSPMARVSRVRQRLMMTRQFTFWAIMMFQLRLIEGGTTAGTMETDGSMLRFDPDFVNKLSDEELIGVVIHEITHIVLAHPYRHAGRDPRKWLVAIDYAVNDVVHQLMESLENVAGLKFQLPKDHIWDVKYRGLTADEIYARLERSSQPEPNIVWVTGCPDGLDKDDSEGGQGSGGQGSGQQPSHNHGHCGGVLEAKNADGSAMSPEERRAAERRLQQRIIQAVTVAQKSQGLVPAGLERFLDELMNPKIPWQEYIREFLEVKSRNDYNFTRPNRKHIMSGIVMPTLHDMTIETLALPVDTSGSVSPAELASYMSEISGILEAFNIGTVYVIYCDAQVHHVEEYSSDDLPLRGMKPKGGGGTDYRPPFQWLEEHGINPAMMVYFGDGYISRGEFPSEPPAYPVLWASSGVDNPNAFPFGEIVKVEL